MIKTQSNSLENLPDKFAYDCLQFFKGKQDVDIDQYSYSDQIKSSDCKKSGAQIWEDYLKNAQDYYPFYSEVEILKNYMYEIMSVVGQSDHLIELGPGPQYSVQEKTSKFLKYSNMFKTYTAVDMSEDYLRQSALYLSSRCNDLEVNTVKGDFFNDFIFLGGSVSNKKNPVVLMLGNTIANIPEHDMDDFPNNLFKVMRRMKNIFPSGTTFIFGHDINQNESSIMSSYNHPLFIEHELNIFKTIKRDLKINSLDEQAFNLNFDWDPKRYCLDIYANSTRPQKVDILGQKIIIQRDTKLHITKSYKYPVDLMKAIGRQAGFIPLVDFKDSSDRMAVHVWKC